MAKGAWAACLCAALWAGGCAADPRDVLADISAQLTFPKAAVSMALGRPSVVETWTQGAFRQGGRALRPEDRMLLASISKTYTAVALLAAQDRGLIDLGDPLARWVNLDWPSLGQITVRQALEMRTGLPDYLGDPDYLDAAFSGPWTMPADKALAFVQGARPAFPPGTAFDYSNTNFLLAQLALEAATGQPFAQALHDLVLAPADLRETAVLGAGARPGVIVQGLQRREMESMAEFRRLYCGPGLGDGGLVASARDVVLFADALWTERTLLSGTALQQLTFDPDGDGYGLGVDIVRDDALGLVWGHAGGDLGASTDFRYQVQTGLVAVVLIAEGDVDADSALPLLDNAQ